MQLGKFFVFVTIPQISQEEEKGMETEVRSEPDENLSRGGLSQPAVIVFFAENNALFAQFAQTYANFLIYFVNLHPCNVIFVRNCENLTQFNSDKKGPNYWVLCIYAVLL